MIRSAKTEKYGASFKTHVSERGILVIQMAEKHQKQHGGKALVMARKMFEHTGKAMFV
jgi:hypothetical protein